jgi:membrane protease subunit (stomatin/prohibitin family)
MEFHDQISVIDLSLAKAKMTESLIQDNCKLAVESETHVSVKRGSQAKLRLVGGMLVDIKTFPVRLTLDFSSLSGPGVIKVSGFDDLGFGLMIGMEEKYQRAIIDIMAVAVNSVASLRVDGESPVQQPMSQAPANYCSQCGAILKPEARFCSGCGQPA